MKIRTFHIHPKLDGSSLITKGSSDPANSKPVFHASDVVWQESPHIVFASIDEAVRFKAHGFGDYTVKAFSVDGIGGEVTWQPEGSGARSPFFVTPYNDAGEHPIELTIVLIAVGPPKGGPDQIGAAPQVHAKKCPVKIIFTPRLGD